MDIVQEILNLPNYYYEYFGNDEKIHMVILGGQSCRTSDVIENFEICSQYFQQMEEVYEKKELTEDDKKILALNMHKIQRLCDSRKEGIHSLKEQKDYLNKLKGEEVKQLELQVKMYKEARRYYKDYIYKCR